jgi:hypothetical protein
MLRVQQGDVWDRVAGERDTLQDSVNSLKEKADGNTGR